MEFTKAKAIVAAVGAFVETLKVILLDNVVDINEWASLGVSAFVMISTVYAVFRVKNVPVS